MSHAKLLLLAFFVAPMIAPSILTAAPVQSMAMKNMQTAPGHAMVPKALIGAWTLVRCDNVYPDGHRVELYGPNPEGLWLIDAQGDYMMQIVRAKRMPFAVNDKSKGTADE